MNHIFFITHGTLGDAHAHATFYGMSIQTTTKKFDTLYLYNSHQHEMSNEWLTQLYQHYDLGRFFNRVAYFPYDPETPKNLAGDIGAIRNFCAREFESTDRVLLMKSDIVLSKNYFDVILNIPEERHLVYFTAPFINAKARVSDEEIFKYVQRERYIPSDDITFLVENQMGNGTNDFNARAPLSITDKQFLFGSCYVISDFSCHYISVNLLPDLELHADPKPWGIDAYIRFPKLFPHFIGTDRCFTVHKFHSVVNDIRAVEREGPSALWWAS